MLGWNATPQGLSVNDSPTFVALSLGSGSVSVPSVALGDANTGIYSTGAGLVDFALNGVRGASFRDDGSSAFLYLLRDSSQILFGASQDAGVVRRSAGLIEINSGTSGTYRDLIARALYSSPSSANGQSLAVQSLTELTTIAAAATTDTTIQMPAGAIILAVSVRVTVLIPTAANFTVGDSGSAARFNTGSNVLVAAGTTNAGTKAGAYYNASALAVRITPDMQPADNTGRVRVTIHYLESTPPTS